MNDETRDDKDADEVETGPRGGERLRAAREEQQIALLEIAKELHLDEPKVRALERNEFDALGAPVFAKGHLRKYAELVGVDEREVLGDYHELTRSSGMPPVVGKRRRPGSELSPGPWIAVVLVVIAAAFAYWWFTAGRHLSTSSAVIAPSAEPVVESEAPAADTVSAPAISQADEEGDAEPEVDTTEPVDAPAEEVISDASEPAAEPEPVVATSIPVDPEPVAPSIEGGVVVTLSFEEDCWTEVTDNSGQRLFFDLGRAGSTVNVEGVAPLSVLLGSANGVTVRVNGEDYPIRADQRRGRTARLTLP